jgi:hypothetical protein
MHGKQFPVGIERLVCTLPKLTRLPQATCLGMANGGDRETDGVSKLNLSQSRGAAASGKRGR